VNNCDRTPVLPPGFVTLTTKAQSLGGPLLFAVMSAIIDVPSPETDTIDALGDGPQPFSNVTEAPLWKPLPVITTLSRVVPFTISVREMPDTVTPTGVSSLVIVPTPRLSEIVHPEQLVKLTKKVSSDSTVSSPFTTTIMVSVGDPPSLKFMVPPVFAT